eukprot:36914-Ditylum_brightwellii.AAC.1
MEQLQLKQMLMSMVMREKEKENHHPKRNDIRNITIDHYVPIVQQNVLYGKKQIGRKKVFVLLKKKMQLLELKR